MTGPDFEFFCQLIRNRSGLVLTPEKAYLVTSRLGPIARGEGLPGGVAELLAKLRSGAGEALTQRCVDAMATHESFFFRDNTPFELLAQRVLPDLIEARRNTRTIRIWCAACSSGQEPYSVAMVLQELSHLTPGWRLEVVATDMSEPILKKAKSGLYSGFEVNRGLSEQRLQRWFTRDGTNWRVAPALQQMVTFRPHNLLQSAAALGSFDVVLCRNVLIYFDVAQKRKILDEIAKMMPSDGQLFLGSAETVIGVTDAFELTPEAKGLYRLARAQERQARIA